ncbi:unnamed protein product [Chrysoparadoxa australica]
MSGFRGGSWADAADDSPDEAGRLAPRSKDLLGAKPAPQQSRGSPRNRGGSPRSRGGPRGSPRGSRGGQWDSPGQRRGSPRSRGQDGGSPRQRSSGARGAAASERWRTHSERFQQQQSQNKVTPENINFEKGRVVSLREQFGFIARASVPGDLFFHFSEAPPGGVKEGDCVEFVVQRNLRSGKDCATRVKVLPPGSVEFEKTYEGLWKGVVERECKMMGGKRAMAMRGDREPQGHEMGILVVEGSTQAPAADAAAADNDDGGSKGEPEHPIGKRAGFMLEMGDVKLVVRKGDEVEFKLSEDLPTRKLTASAVKVTCTARERSDKASQEAVERTGAKREHGVIRRMNGDYGFIKGIDSKVSGSVFFSLSEVKPGSEGTEHLRVVEGTEVEYYCIPDQTRDGTDSWKAVQVTLLPHGTIGLEEMRESQAEGKVERAPGYEKDRTIGSGRFTLDGKHVAVPILAKDVQPYEGEPAAPCLEVNDIVTADLVLNKITNKTAAKRVQIKAYRGPREHGKVLSMKDGFGFIRACSRTHDVFFRFKDICKGGKELKERSDVSFNMVDSDRGDKPRATRVETLPDGTAWFERELATGVSGVIVKEAKGTLPGTIKVTSSVSLDLDPDIEYPDMTLEIKTFAKDMKRKVLLLEATLPSTQRRAAHLLAEELGLGHRFVDTGGEEREGQRQLKLWKMETDEEKAEMAAESQVKLEKYMKKTAAANEGLLLKYTSKSLVNKGPAPAGSNMTFDVIYDRPSHSRKAVKIRGETKEYQGIVAAVNRQGKHYGFIMDAANDESIFFHLSEVKTDGDDSVGSGSGGGSFRKEALISVGQEVSFVRGVRNGKTIAMSVKKLAKGSVSLEAQEEDGGRYSGLVVISPRKLADVDTNAEGASDDDFEGSLVVLSEAKAGTEPDGGDEAGAAAETKAETKAVTSAKDFPMRHKVLKFLSSTLEAAEDGAAEAQLLRGDLVEFSLMRKRVRKSSVRVANMKLLQRQALPSIKGIVEEMDHTKNIGYIGAISTGDVQGEDRVSFHLREIVGSLVRMRVDAEVSFLLPPGWVGAGGRAVGVVQTADLETIQTRRGLNVELREALKKSGTKIGAQVKMAQGPGEGQGFEKGSRTVPSLYENESKAT